MKSTGLVYDPIYLEHKIRFGHPESPERLKAVMENLEEAGLLSKLELLKPVQDSLKWIKKVHLERYVERVKYTCLSEAPFVDTPDAPVSAESYEAALAAAGGVISALDAVMAPDSEVENAFCAIRPPGHHALKNQAMGFCLFNNIAIAVHYLREKYNISKVLIVDWDVHHGNGTQAAFYDDPGVLYFSTHQSPFYPGSGSDTETGQGEGKGYTLNVPLPSGSGDSEYKRAFEEVLRPRALDYNPGFVLISAGFDLLETDLLGGMEVSAECVEQLTVTVNEIAETCCSGRCVSMLEGGYNLERLAEGVKSHILGLMK